MFRLFRFKNLMALIWILFIFGVVLQFISTGWVDISTHLSQLLLIGVFAYFLNWNMQYRQEHDPVRQTWDAFWGKFTR